MSDNLWPDAYIGREDHEAALAQAVAAQHHVTCNHRHQPIGGPGCVCVVKNKYSGAEEVAQTRQEATEAERKRCREQEVEPVKTACSTILKHLREEYVAGGFLEDDEGDIAMISSALAAVEKIQKESK